MVEQSFVMDVNAPSFNFQIPQYNAFFGQQVMTMRQVRVFFYPFVQNFADHPLSQGLEQMLLPFASPISITGADTSLRVLPVAMTSDQSGKQGPPVMFDINRQYTEADFSFGVQNLAVSIEGKMGGENDAKIVVIGDGDFAIESEQIPMLPDNIHFLVNSIDWLTDDTGLIELRTRGVVSRPIEQLEDGERMTIKLLNFFLPIVVLIVFGVVRAQRRRMRRFKWMSENYS